MIGKKVTTKFGKIGTDGRIIKKRFKKRIDAKKFMADRTKRMMKRGYYKPRARTNAMKAKKKASKKRSRSRS